MLGGAQMKLFGREWTRDQLERYVGDISQVGGVTRYTATEGVAAGVEVVEFRTGTGLRFDVLTTRGMDIGSADYCGIPLAWQSGVGYMHPAYFEEQGYGWLRSFNGGLLTTCGLTYMGAPCVDNGQALGLHGRASALPARNVCVDAAWQDNQYVMWARGAIRETSVFGEKVQLTRQITAWLGSSNIRVTETVENLNYTPVEHMLLYHINLGYPLIGPDSRILATPHRVTPRDAEAALGGDQWPSFDLPTPGYAEKVYLHEIPAGDEYMAAIAVAAPQAGSAGLALQLRYDVRTLPYLTQWKMCGEGAYVLGLEPGNAFVMGRSAEREAGRLQVLSPRETRRYTVEFSVEPMS
jgi:hypothetical protein